MNYSGLSKALAIVIAIIIIAAIIGIYFFTRPGAPAETTTPTKPTSPTPRPSPSPTTSPQSSLSPSPSPTPQEYKIKIGASEIRVSKEFYEFVEKVRKGELKVTINFWTSMMPFESNIVGKAVKEFMNEYPGVTVNYQNVQNLKEAVKAGVIAGDLENTAHVFTWAHDWTGELADGGFIVALDQYLPPKTLEDLRREYLAVAYSAGVYKLHLYGLPWAGEAIALICNLDMVGKAPKTFDEMKQVMEKYHDPSKGTYGIAYQIDPYHIYPFVTAFGGYYYNEETDSVGVNSTGTIEGIKFFVENVLKYMYTEDVGHEAQLKLFTDGKTPFIVTGPWNIPRIREAISNIAVVPLPMIGDKVPNPFSGIKLVWITKLVEKNRDRLYASILFSLWFTLNDDTLKMFVSEAGFIPVKNSVLGYVKDNADKYSIVLGFAQSIANSVLMPKSVKMASVWGPVTESINAIITKYNEDGVKAALESIKPLLDEAQAKILESFKR